MTQCFSSEFFFLLSTQMFFYEHRLSILSSVQWAFQICISALSSKKNNKDNKKNQKQSLQDVPKPEERIHINTGIWTELLFSLCWYHRVITNNLQDQENPETNTVASMTTAITCSEHALTALRHCLICSRNGTRDNHSVQVTTIFSK